MLVNLSPSDIGYIVNLTVLIILFLYIFKLICTTSGKCKIQQICLLVALYGVGTCLGAQVFPSVVTGWWRSLGSFTPILGWLSYCLIDLYHARQKRNAA